MKNESENANSNLSLIAKQKDIKNLIAKLKRKTAYFCDIPKEYRYHPKIVSCERECGIRKSSKRGYDVICNNFFVEELILVKEWSSKVVEKHITSFFADFTSFYKFLQGDIYENACYYKYNFSTDEIAEFKIDIEKINTKSLIDYDIDSSNLNSRTNLIFSINKGYDRNTSNFYVEQIFYDEKGQVIRTDRQSFKYFFDFVHFLKCDLSDADLLFCDGLENITDFGDLNLNNAKLRSSILDRLGIKYEICFNDNTVDFPAIQNNELETIDALTAERTLNSQDAFKCQKIYYISDLHLLHRLINANSRNLFDAVYIIQKIIDNLLKDIQELEKNIILIGGDTASHLSLFELFIKSLRTSIDKKNLDVQVIFTLGNHELWDFSGIPFDEIVEKYRKVIKDNGMYLLQNNLIIKYDWNKIEEISTDELKNMTKTELANRLKTARLILFGGLGFAGYNEEFNANQGIYRFALNRKQELEESKKFELLYDKVCTDLIGKRVVIFTHMPQKDWCSHNKQCPGFVYVNGHTHRNCFYDDGDYRIYADNQIGYYKKSCRLKYFYLEDDFDLFVDYKDGVYEITREQYIDFYCGKNIFMSFERNFHKLYMLKKNGYYLFILQSANGNLNILNGGNLKELKHKTVYYYFENMDSVIAEIKSPLANFSNYQKRISDEIKAIGGYGTIHGAIVDIDFFNHVYVNPLDLSITAYYATDIIKKVIFPNTSALLKNNCPELYLTYLKLLENSSSTELALSGSDSKLTEAPQIYLDTDIYRASREIKKMQKLNSNILSFWTEPTNNILSDTEK